LPDSETGRFFSTDDIGTGTALFSDDEISTGAVEGLNNKIRGVTRRSYGFRTYNAMEMALYHTLGRLPEPESARRFCWGGHK